MSHDRSTIDTKQRPHISPTQLEMYARCPESYRRRYIEGEILPPAIALIKGKTFHKAAETNFRQKIATHDDLPLEEFRGIAAAAFEAELAGGYALMDEEVARGSKAVIGEAKDATIEMVEVHANKQAPDYQPVLVEETIRIGLPGTHDLLGVIDLADDKDRVVDFKTAARKKSQGDADTSVQLTTYAASYQARTGRIPLLVLDSIVKTKTKTERQALTSSRNDRDYTALANRINAITAGINAKIFPPAPVGAWNCSPKWCGYYGSCPYVNSERKAAANGDGD